MSGKVFPAAMATATVMDTVKVMDPVTVMVRNKFLNKFYTYKKVRFLKEANLFIIKTKQDQIN